MFDTKSFIFYNKYLKYKQKYLELKYNIHTGGAYSSSVKNIIDEINNYIEKDPTRTYDNLKILNAVNDLLFMINKKCKIIFSCDTMSSNNDKKQILVNGGITNEELLELINIISKDSPNYDEMQHFKIYNTEGLPSGTEYSNDYKNIVKIPISLIYHEERLEVLSYFMNWIKNQVKYNKSKLQYIDTSSSSLLNLAVDWIRNRPKIEDDIIAILHGSTSLCKHRKGGYVPIFNDIDEALAIAYSKYLTKYDFFEKN